MNHNTRNRLSYFLRGLGVGIVFTTILFTVGSRGQSKKIDVDKLSKDEIIELAKEYGMVESLDQKLDAIESSMQPTSTPAPSSTVEPTQKPTMKPTVEPTVTSESSANTSQKTYATIVVKPGNGAEVIADQLKNSGIIDNKSEFLSYLQKNNYTKKILVGSYQIPEDATYKQIARTLTSGY